jgi:osmotically-inducible protein OsmY
MELVDRVRQSVQHIRGRGGDGVRVSIEGHGRVIVTGTVEDEAARSLVLDAVAKTSGVESVADELEVKLELGDEAGPKSTEFAREADARAMTGTDFPKID